MGKYTNKQIPPSHKPFFIQTQINEGNATWRWRFYWWQAYKQEKLGFKDGKGYICSVNFIFINKKHGIHGNRINSQGK